MIAYLLSNNRKKIPIKTVVYGLICQLIIAVFMLKTPVGIIIFKWVNKVFVKLLGYSDKGSELLFGKLVHSNDIGATLAFQALPVIIFVSAVMGILVYFGIIQFIIKLLARVFYKTLKITGVEAFIVSLLIFMGIESITGVKEYIKNMNQSRIFTIMVTFMATIAGSVMAAYMSFGAKAGHLLTASLMSAPAAIVISKIMIPDVDSAETDPLNTIKIEKRSGSPIEAIANGTSDGLNLVLQIAAMLIAFMAIVYFLNGVFGKITGITLESFLGYLLSPVAFLLGIPPGESVEVGKLLGIKTLFTEFISYLQLKTHIINQTLSGRTIAITTYALCGFTHFGSVAILIGGIGTLVPIQKPVVSRLAIKALIAGFLATSMTAAIAGLLINSS
ncbi:MAG: NupC/NupG family nucleoside CNT transporter [Candidatus Aminicenantes bacterium]|nr:NupC/NupG family nucleoside CNT transporter [Candidatus Aminicenantes bacterium]